jgi:hypothetical protein
MQCHDNMSVLSVPHQKKLLPNIDGVCIVGGKMHLSLLLVLTRQSYAIVVSVPTKEHNIHMTYITTYPPSGARGFNAARTALHTLRECIQVLRKRPQDIPRSPRPRCAVVASRMIDMQPIPHDRDCPQANLALRGQVRVSHHPARGYLPSYIFVSVSLLKCNCRK